MINIVKAIMTIIKYAKAVITLVWLVMIACLIIVKVA